MRFHDGRMTVSTSEIAWFFMLELIALTVAVPTWGLSPAIVSLLLFFYYKDQKAQEQSMRQLAQVYEEQLAAETDRLADFQTFDTYMTGRTSESLRNTLISMLRKMESLPKKYSDLWAPTVESTRHSLKFINNYNPRYFEVQKGRHASFFDGTLYHGGHAFNDEQIQAILTNDYNNLVIAGPGSGKTRTLVARVAFFVHYQGIPENRILVLAYNKNAAEEVIQRLAREYGIEHVRVMTFHSLGFRILHSAGRANNRNAVEDRGEHVMRQIVDNLLNTDESFQEKCVGYLTKWKAEGKEDDSAVTQERLQQKMMESYVALDGTRVKSLAERDIANFFILHGIQYEYEKEADWCDKDEKNPKRTYHPDFYLPDYDIYLEHWAVTSSNKTPGNFAKAESTKYLNDMKWKHEQFQKHQKTLWETNHTMFVDGTLVSEISRKLKEVGVEPVRISYLQLLKKAGLSSTQCSLVSEPICSAVKAAKVYGLDSAGLAKRAQEVDKSNRRDMEDAQFVLDLVISVFERYEQHLRDKEKIDFEDMINHAVTVLEAAGTPPGTSPIDSYKMILVDEFQDISYQRLGLLAALQRLDPDCRLFCVGDDWQAIYGFAGSSAHYIIHFDKWFPTPVRVYLTQNYRNPPETLSFASEVIEKCSQRLAKTLVPSHKYEPEAEHPPLVFKRIDAKDELGFRSRQNDDAQGMIQKLIDGGADPSEVLVLSRFNFGYSRLQQDCKDSDIPVEFRKQGITTREGVRFMSIHKSKGLETDFVILLNTFDGLFGFPPKIGSRLSFSFINRDLPDHLDEERRLMFVGSTRAKKQCVVYTWRSRESQLLTSTKRYAAHFRISRSNIIVGSVVQESELAYRIQADLSPSFKPVFWVPKSVTKVLSHGDDGEPNVFEIEEWWYEKEGEKIFEED